MRSPAATHDALRPVIEASKALLSELDADRLLSLILQRAVELVSAERGLLMLADASGALSVREARGFASDAFDAGGLPISRSVADEVQATGRPILTTSAPEDDAVKGRHSVRLLRLQTLMCAPLRVGGRALGVLYVDATTLRSGFDAVGLAAFELLADLAAIALENARLYQLATTDPRTGLPHVGAFRARLEAEWSRVHREGGALALIMVDLDHFKRINDTLGHPAGDRVLVALAGILQGISRADDLPARIGGEEFALLLVLDELGDAGRERPRAIAERVRRTIAAHNFGPGLERPLSVTASLGLATWPAPGIDDPDALIAAADRNLYLAKAQGRDRVVG